MSWARRRMQLWHPDSPGVRVDVDVLRPRAWWLEQRQRRVADDPEGRFPIGFATSGEVLRKYDRDGVGLRPVRIRFVCWLLGHRVVRHITALDMPRSSPLVGAQAWSLQVKPTDWYFQCSRCRRTASRDWSERAGALEDRPLWRR